MTNAQPKYNNAPVVPNANPNFLMLMWFMVICFNVFGMFFMSIMFISPMMHGHQ